MEITSDPKGAGPWRPGPRIASQALAVDRSGNVYLGGPSKIKKFTSSGEPIPARERKAQASKNRDAEASGLVTDAAGDAYATVGDGVQVFSPAGRLLAKWGPHGKGSGGSSGLQGIATDPSGNVYVADSENKLIQKFSPIGAVSYCFVPNLVGRKLPPAREALRNPAASWGRSRARAEAKPSARARRLTSCCRSPAKWTSGSALSCRGHEVDPGIWTPGLRPLRPHPDFAEPAPVLRRVQ